jgi:hypothetical protein
MTRDFEISVKYSAWQAAMRRISDTELPEAIAAGINRIAGGAAKAQAMNLRQRFTLRNKYAERSLIFFPAKPGKNINSINAIVGSRQPFLALQEAGGTEKATGRSLAMPTLAGRGGDKGKAIPGRFRIRSMGTFAGNSRGFFILGPGPRLKQPAIFWRQPRYGGAMVRRNRPGQGTLNKLYKIRLLGRKTQTVKARHWHSDAVDKYAQPGFAAMAFIAEAKRRLAKYQAG